MEEKKKWKQDQNPELKIKKWKYWLRCWIEHSSPINLLCSPLGCNPGAERSLMSPDAGKTVASSNSKFHLNWKVTQEVKFITKLISNKLNQDVGNWLRLLVIGLGHLSVGRWERWISWYLCLVGSGIDDWVTHSRDVARMQLAIPRDAFSWTSQLEVADLGKELARGSHSERITATSRCWSWWNR